MNQMLKHKIFAERWFIWSLVVIVVSGLSLISYLRWVEIEISAENILTASEFNLPQIR